jgi:two-component system chemotaxis response regulator CheY
VIDKSNDNVIGRSKVLIVDDEYHARKSLRQLLLGMGCGKIHEASDGAMGLEAIATFDADVVLLDWDMQDIKGAEFVRRLRSHARCSYAGVPVVMLTTHGERILEAVRHGVHEFLLKPVSGAALKARMLSALGQQAPLRVDANIRPGTSKLAS